MFAKFTFSGQTTKHSTASHMSGVYQKRLSVYWAGFHTASSTSEVKHIQSFTLLFYRYYYLRVKELIKYSISPKWERPSHFWKHFGIFSKSFLKITVILRKEQIYTLIQAVHLLLYIVGKCHYFSVVTGRDIIKWSQKCEGCTHLITI